MRQPIGIVDDPREIVTHYSADGGITSTGNEIDKIVAYQEPGNGAYVPALAFYSNGEVVRRHIMGPGEGVEYASKRTDRTNLGEAMKITRIRVHAGRTFNDPNETYQNFRPAVNLEAELEPGDTPQEATAALRGIAEDHIQRSREFLLAESDRRADEELAASLRCREAQDLVSAAYRFLSDGGAEEPAENIKEAAISVEPGCVYDDPIRRRVVSALDLLNEDLTWDQSVAQVVKWGKDDISF